MMSSTSNNKLLSRRRHSLDVTTLQSVGLLSKGRGVAGSVRTEVDVLEETSPVRHERSGTGGKSSASTAVYGQPMSLLHLRGRRSSDTMSPPEAVLGGGGSGCGQQSSVVGGLVIRRVRTAEDGRTTSYEEELELRLEHVRMRAVNAEQRLAVERLKRRQLAQRLADVEQTNRETMASIGAQTEQRIERLKARSKLVSARCDQLRQDARSLEERLRATERRAAQEKNELEARLAAAEAEVERCRASEERTENENERKRSLIEEDLRPKVDKQQSKSSKVDDASVWCGFYEILTQIALSRVHYLEDRIVQKSAAAGGLGQQNQLRQRGGQVVVNLTAAEDDGSPPPSPPPHYFALRRTSSCPLTLPGEAGVDAVATSSTPQTDPNGIPSVSDPTTAAAAATSRRGKRLLQKTTSVDLGDDRRGSRQRSGNASTTSTQFSDDVLRSCLSSLDCDSAFRSCSSSVSPRDDFVSSPVSSSYRADLDNFNNNDDDDGPFSKSLDSGTAEMTPDNDDVLIIGGNVIPIPTARSSSPSKTPAAPMTPKTKRHSSLHLDIFRKIQTGVRRRDRPSSAMTDAESQRCQPMKATPLNSPYESTTMLASQVINEVGVPLRNGRTANNTSSSVPNSPMVVARHQRRGVDSLVGPSTDPVTEETSELDRPETPVILGGTLDRQCKSSFGRLQNRRNGVTSVDPSHTAAVGATTGGFGRTPPQKAGRKLDQIARNFKTYLHTQTQ